MTTSAPQSQPQALSSEEEAVKRNTDCVYFLASPLTCKKGSDCDYRHSDVARLNPRDCYYWLNSNCLNPKCAFRHPPLDGLLGTQAPASSGSSASLPRPANPAVSHAQNSSAVPCVFFKRGYCMKGEWCPFLHMTNSSGSKAVPVPAAALPAETKTSTAGSTGAPQKVLPKNVFPAPAPKPVKAALQEKSGNDISAPQRDAFSISDFSDSHGHQPSHSISNGNLFGISGRGQQLHHLSESEGVNSKDLEGVSREPSPGFDVLVDDEERQSDYYIPEDRYGIPGEHDAQNELDIGHPTGYRIIAGIDDERYQDSMLYDPHQQRHLASERQRSLSERMSGGTDYERSSFNRPRNFSRIDDMDLRHRLANNKRPNSLRSVINNEAFDTHIQDKGYHNTEWDEQNTSSRDRSFSGRLRGRVGLPIQSSSPGDATLSRGAGHSFHGRMRGQEPFTNSGRDNGGSHFRRDASFDNNGDFPAPKSLSELKNGKYADTSGHTQIDSQFGKRKRVNSDGQADESSLSFEGPKSLQEILKRKRGEVNGMTSNTTSAGDQARTIADMDTETKSDTANQEDDKQFPSESILKTEDGIGNGEDDIYLEDGTEQNGEEYEYNQEYEDEDEEYYEDQNVDAVEGDHADDQNEDEEEDDDDDFAKKMGVAYS